MLSTLILKSKQQQQREQHTKVKQLLKRTERMPELLTNIDGLAFMAASLPRGLGFIVQEKQSDDQSIKTVLKAQDVTLYITVVNLEDEFYSITYTSKQGTRTLTAALDFSFYDTDLDFNLPSSEEIVSSVLEGFEGDWSSITFIGYLLKRFRIVPQKILPEELNVIGSKALAPIISGKAPVANDEVDPLVERLKASLSHVFIIPGQVNVPPAFFNKNVKNISTDEPEKTYAPSYQTLKDHPLSSSSSSSASSKAVNLPTFDDEYEINKKPRADQSLQRGIPSVGRDDVYGPVGKYPEMRPGITGPIGGFNGMIVDKNHPLFGQTPGAGVGRFAPPGVPGAPPGARGDDPFGSIDDNVGMGLPYGSSRAGSRGGFGGGFGGPMGGPFGGPPGFDGFI